MHNSMLLRVSYLRLFQNVSEVLLVAYLSLKTITTSDIDTNDFDAQRSKIRQGAHSS